MKSGTPPLTPQFAGSSERPLSISQANTLLAHALSVSLPPTFFIQGEISNFRTYDRGHAFFTLKDAAAELPCILWKDALQRLKFRPNDGISVIAKGSVRLYEPQGKIQLYVDTLYPLGAGALEFAYRQLCDKLRREGLFEPGRKRPLPHLPRHIVIITSRTGDVLHDVLTTAWRRFPALHVSLYPVRVQGDQAAPDIIRAIENINAHEQKIAAAPPSKIENQKSKIQLILLVRGGGSLEDLWAFNDEALARAIAASAIPIATGIGHEPDTTIADLVGDLRGPTPTGIAELTIPDARALLSELENQSALLTRDLRRTLESAKNAVERRATALAGVLDRSMRSRHEHLGTLAQQIARIEPRHAIAQGWRRLDDAGRHAHAAASRRLRAAQEHLTKITHRLDRANPQTRLPRHRDRLANLHFRLIAAVKSRLAASAQKLTGTENHLAAISPAAVLQRGYSITTDKSGTIIRNASQVQRGDLLTTQLAEGQITSTVGKPKQSTLF
jgi:exodeoxyribonuclease VII large subunit